MLPHRAGDESTWTSCKETSVATSNHDAPEPHRPHTRPGACRRWLADGDRAVFARAARRHRGVVRPAAAENAGSFLLLRRPPQRRLQARAGRHQPVPGRLQQSQPGGAGRMRAGGPDGGRTRRLRGPHAGVDPGEPHPQPLLSGEHRRSRRHSQDRRPHRPRRLAAADTEPPHRGADGRADVVRAAAARRSPGPPSGCRARSRPAEQRSLRRRADHPHRRRASGRPSAERRLGGAPQVEPFRKIPHACPGVLPTAPRRSVADRSAVVPL